MSDIPTPLRDAVRDRDAVGDVVGTRDAMSAYPLPDIANRVLAALAGVCAMSHANTAEVLLSVRRHVSLFNKEPRFSTARWMFRTHRQKERTGTIRPCLHRFY